MLDHSIGVVHAWVLQRVQLVGRRRVVVLGSSSGSGDSVEEWSLGEEARNWIGGGQINLGEKLLFTSVSRARPAHSPIYIIYFSHSGPLTRLLGFFCRLGLGLDSDGVGVVLGLLTPPSPCDATCPQVGAIGNRWRNDSKFSQVANETGSPDHLIRPCNAGRSPADTRRCRMRSGIASDAEVEGNEDDTGWLPIACFNWDT